MRLIDRFLEETRKEVAFLSDLRADLDDGVVPLRDHASDAAVAAIEGRIAECRERIEKLACYSMQSQDRSAEG